MEPLTQFQRGLDPSDPKQAAFMLAVRRAGTAASYVPYSADQPPWHAAVAAPYAHATAPLRRLADRYVVQTVMALANGQRAPDAAIKAFEKLPEVMARADALSSRIERAVVDLAETVMLQGREGEVFQAIVTDTDERGARIQLRELPVVARVAANHVEPGEDLRVRLVSADPEHPPATFQRVS
jgi:exoribonuclease R